MTDTFKMVGAWMLTILVAFVLLVLPALVMLRLTRGIKERHPLPRLLVVLLPSSAIVIVILFFTLTRGARSPAPSVSQPPESEPLPPPLPESRPQFLAFPWPPPTPSARLLIPKEALPQAKTFGQASSYLESALSSKGYAEISYYTVPGGVAVVTRLEHIYSNGKSFEEPNRWVADDKYRQSLSLYRLRENAFRRR